jgi:outer membrane protein
MIPQTLKWAALTCVAVACMSVAQAQSLLELYEAAKSYDAAVLAARANTKAAEFKAAQADALSRPSASLSGGASTRLVDRPAGTGDSNTIGASVKGSFPLFNRGNESVMAQARRRLQSARIDLQSSEQDLIIRLSQAYFDVLSSQQALEATKASKAAITDQLASARRNFEVGTATITDTREAQARFDLALADEIAAENDLRTKRIALDQLVGVAGVSPKPLRAGLILPPVQPDEVQSWVEKAASEHPSVVKAAIGVELAKLESAVATAAERPTVDAVGELSTSRAGGTAAQSRGQTSFSQVGIEFKMPLYSGGKTQNVIREAAELETKARNDLSAAQRGVSQFTRQAFFTVQSGRARIKALEAAEASSRLALEATQLGYRVGVRVNLDVLNAQTQLFQTRANLARAMNDSVLAGLRLKLASGQLTAQDLAEVSGLLER